MGVAPSRETIRRGFFNVNQAGPGSTSGAGGGPSGGGGGGKRQDIILIPLTREYFPSPDCPLFVQFHKARCDAAVNYYFRRPGNPGDLSCIPNYASSYRLPGEETRAQRRRRRQQERAARSAAAGEANEVPVHEGAEGHSSSDGDEDGDADDEEDEDDSYPSREALYRGVIDHVEEALFDTDAEMRQAYEWALAHPHTTMGPDGKKQRKVLPVLCAVAFRSDLSKVHSLHGAAGPAGAPPSAASAAAASGRPFAPAGGAAPAAASPASAGGALPPLSPSSNPAGCSTASIAMSNMQAALENGVYMFGSIINIVGCFGFVSMQEDVEDARRATTQANALATHSATLLTPGSMQSPSSVPGGTYHHDPYSFTSSQASSGSMRGATSPMTSSGTLLSTRGTGGQRAKGGRHLAHISSAENVMTLPVPVAAPLAAMVFLTKSAGEQNLGRVTYIAASTYYFQMIQAGLIERQPGVRMEGPVTYPSPTTSAASGMPPPLPSYGAHGGAGLPPHPPMYGSNAHVPVGGVAGSPVSGMAPAMPAAFSSMQSPTTATPAAPPPQGPPRPFMPPMETFSFSSLLTNIPILSFLYEMKWRWGYLGVLKGGTPTGGTSRNSSFNASVGNNNAAANGGAPFHPISSMGGGPGMTARGPGSMMGNHSTGGLAGIDRSVGQGVTDEMEMWITADQMIHGRISKDLAQRLCWSLAERPEVMQERVAQLPSEESGYWRYRGLADQAHPPPVPEPGRVVTIHPKDVYVMGSDVFPGFNEGDILRFDPERLVWFTDHAIPLEGVVLAAMRPYCKQAREADSEDPAWVTRVCDGEEAEALHSGEGDAWYPAPRPSEAELAALQADANLVHIHEHVGNFYVYRFERDGTAYYHGTVPNFANPNKKKQAGAAAATLSSASGGGLSSLGASLSSAQPSQPPAGAAAPSAGPKAGTASATTSASTSKPTQPAATPSTNTSSTSVPVPKTIASALFSLLPASRAQAAEKPGSSSAGGGAAAAPGSAGTVKGAGEGGAGGGPAASPASTAPHGGASAAGPTTTTAYLATPVTSDAMNTARRWVQALYSYAYGAPNSHPTRRGPAPTVPPAGAGGGSGASAAAGAGPGGAGPLGVRPASRRYVPSGLALGPGLGFNAAPGGSYPSTPLHGARGSMTPTSAGAASGGFPGNAMAVDVPVWPTPKQRLVPPTAGTPLLSPTASASVYGTGGGGGSQGTHTPGTSSLGASAGGGVCNFVYHSRSSSRVQAGAAGAAGGGLAADEAAAASYASRPIKRYTEGGSYEWDWRR